MDVLVACNYRTIGDNNEKNMKFNDSNYCFDDAFIAIKDDLDDWWLVEYLEGLDLESKFKEAMDKLTWDYGTPNIHSPNLVTAVWISTNAGIDLGAVKILTISDETPETDRAVTRRNITFDVHTLRNIIFKHDLNCLYRKGFSVAFLNMMRAYDQING